MELRQLKYFMDVIESSSFTEAAEINYISQSAISQQMKLLEDELGVQLLVRRGKKFTVSPAGEYLYRHCKAILDDVERLKRETIHHGEDDESQLRIGVLRRYDCTELHQALIQFSKTYLEVDVSITFGDHEQLYHMLRDGRVDMLISDQRRKFDDEYENIIFSRAPVSIEISTNHPIARLEKVDMEDLRGYPCIVVCSTEEQEKERDYFVNTLNYPDHLLWVRSMEEGHLMAAGNRGFMPMEEAGTLKPCREGLTRIPLYRKGVRLTQNYCIFWEKVHANYYIEEFADLIMKLMN